MDLSAGANSEGKDVLNFYDDCDVRRLQNMPVGNKPEGNISSVIVKSAARLSCVCKPENSVVRTAVRRSYLARGQHLSSLLHYGDECLRGWIASVARLQMTDSLVNFWPWVIWRSSEDVDRRLQPIVDPFRI